MVFCKGHSHRCCRTVYRLFASDRCERKEPVLFLQFCFDWTDDTGSRAYTDIEPVDAVGDVFSWLNRNYLVFQTRSEWNVYFFLVSFLTMYGVIVFVFFGSGELQPWARVKPPSAEETDHDGSS